MEGHALLNGRFVDAVPVCCVLRVGMPCAFIDLEGREAILDLDDVVEVADGWSAVRTGWQGFIIYDPKTRKFVELQSNPSRRSRELGGRGRRGVC